MSDSNIFQRYELKYLLTPQQTSGICFALQHFMQKDKYPDTTISNLYFDTPDFLLIRRSLEKPVYKEKLRMRSYGMVTSDSTIFVELKKKYKSIVYKCRIPMSLSEAERYLYSGWQPKERSQILQEITYFREFYPALSPMVFLSYQRESFIGIQDENLRITFDRNILWRREHLALNHSTSGASLLPPGLTLMEIKVKDSMPLWLAAALSEYGIYRTSFSKYGKVYETRLQRQKYLNRNNKKTELQNTGGFQYA